MILVAGGEDEVRESALRLARVGIENVEGYLAGGIAAWEKAGLALAALEHVTVSDLHEQLRAQPSLQVIDVRRPSEYAAGHLPGAVNVPLDTLAEAPLTGDPHLPTAVVCAGGYRSSAGCSLLMRRGFDRLMNVVGGTGAWMQAGYEVDARLL